MTAGLNLDMFGKHIISRVLVEPGLGEVFKNSKNGIWYVLQGCLKLSCQLEKAISTSCVTIHMNNHSNFAARYFDSLVSTGGRSIDAFLLVYFWYVP